LIPLKHFLPPERDITTTTTTTIIIIIIIIIMLKLRTGASGELL
jgi:hypothetical protein